MKGKLISFEGIECSGKGTQIALLMEYLSQHGIAAVADHEPGGTPYGEALRALLKHPEIALPAVFKALAGHSDFAGVNFIEATTNAGIPTKRTPEAELLMYEAARAEYAAKIKAELERGLTVISDRLMDSTVAYQGGGRSLNRQMIEKLNTLAMRGVWPDKTFLLDIPVEIMLKRMRQQSKEKNSYFETTCDRDFFERTRRAYLDIRSGYPNRFVVIDGTKPVNEVFEKIRRHIDRLLNITYKD